MTTKEIKTKSLNGSINWSDQLRKLKDAIKNDLIPLHEAESLLDDIEFYRRCDDILEWGKYYFPDKFGLPFCHELHDYLVAIRNERYTNTLAPRGYAKCLDGDSMINGEFGLKKLRDIKEGEFVYSLNDENKIEPQKVLAIQRGQFKKGYIIKTRTGRELKVSDNHRLFTFDGYLPIEKIKKGDYLGVFNKKVDSDFEIDDDELRFITYMIFDGQTKNRSITLFEKCLINDFQICCENMGFKLNKKKGPNYDYGIIANRTTRVKDLLIKYKIYGCLSINKRLPSEFFRMSYRQKMIFLSIMIDTDGYISQKIGQIGIGLANEDLINDIQTLLSSCGIISTKSYSPNKHAGQWRLSINGIYADQFINDGCVILKKDKLKSILKKSRYSLIDIFPNKIKKNVVNIERLARSKGIRVDNRYEITRNKLQRLSETFPECYEFKKQLDQDIFWDKVESIERIDEIEEYFDIQVEKNESFVANTIISHNTTIKCFLIPIYQALNEPETYRHYLNIQATSTKAVAVNLTIREEIESNELLKKDYGELVGDEKWTEKQFVLKNGVVFTAIGSGDSVRGINYRNTRPDYIIGDDLYDEDDIYSLDRVKKKNNWFWSSIYKALSKNDNAAIHIQGTAIHREDLMHTLPKDIWVSRKFQAIPDMDEKIVLWPEAETFEKLMQDKAQMGSIIFMREMMNDLHDDENAIIKTHWIKYYDALPKVKYYYWSWDTAIEEGTQNDYTVGTLWAECEDGYYLVDMYRKKVDLPDLDRDIRQCFEMTKCRELLVEKKASGHQIVQLFKKYSKYPIIPMTQGKDMRKKKSERLIVVSGLFEAGKVRFPSNKPWMVDVVDELVNFPNASHDDIVDSITMLLERRLNNPGTARVRQL